MVETDRPICNYEGSAYRTEFWGQGRDYEDAVERAALVRANLRRDTERAEQTECTTRDRGLGDVEMDGDLPAPAQVDAAGRVEETRELCEPVALAPRRDRRELAAEVLRE